MLDATGQDVSLDEAIIRLADWIDQARPRLVSDDVAALAEIGSILYREKLRRRVT